MQIFSSAIRYQSTVTPISVSQVLHPGTKLLQVERAVVIVDDRGRSTGSGIVEFSRKVASAKALDSINNGVFYISK